ncbi:RNA-directed DNA polymerase, eukaryota [Tanacetum coccineum]
MNFPVVVETIIEGFRVRRIHVDGGSSSEVMYERCFRNLSYRTRSRLRESRIPLVGFSGEVSYPIGVIDLEVTMGEYGKTRTVIMKFAVVKSPSPYNALLGRTGMRSLRAVASTIHSMMKFPPSNRIATISITRETLRECRQIEEAQDLSRHARIIDLTPMQTSSKVTNPRVLLAPEETLPRRPGKEPMQLDDTEERRQLDMGRSLPWRRGKDSGILMAITEHSLDTYPHIEPKAQKKRSLAPDRRKVVTDEVNEWLKADLNKACPKDLYPLSEINWKIESLMGFQYKCFLDAYKGYHQIHMTTKDEEKTSFHTEEGVFCYTKMPFGLKNAGATYQRLVDFAFKEQIGVNLEAYVDDMVIKSKTEHDIIKDIEQTFSTLRRINMKLNPKKCSFGMEEGKFLGYIVTSKGIRANPKKAKAVMDMPSPKTLKQMQSLSWKLAALNRFLSKSAERSLPFLDTLKKCTNKKDFRWTEATEAAFLKMKKLVSELPTLTTPKKGETLMMGENKLCSDGEALLAGLRIANEMQVKDIHAFVDSKLVASQVEGSYDAKGVSNTHIPRAENRKADALSKLAAVQFDHLSKEALVEVLNEHSVEAQEVNMVVEEEGPTWMTLIRNYLEEGKLPEDPADARTLMAKIGNYTIEDGVLYRKSYLVSLMRYPILFRDVCIDYGATPFRLFHSWFDWDGFDIMVSSVWSSMSLSDSNGMVRFKKKLQHLKKEIRSWVMERKKQNMGNIYDIKSKLHELDVTIDQGGANADILASRLNLMKNLHDIKASEARDYRQKAKIRWAVEGDENSKFFHGIVNKKRSSLSIRGILVDGEWVSDPVRVKEEFRLHFAKRFEEPAVNRSKISFQFPTRLNSDQALDLERPVSCDEIRQAVWGCGEDKSPGPDGFTFEFFRKFWDIIGPDFCVAVKWFFDHSSFSRGCNSSFVALIPKNSDPKFVTDFRPISLIGCLYKVVTKILALRLSAIISGLISDVQTAFVPGRQILDGPFIINELLAWCKHYKHQAMVFKVDFAKAYDSVRWDYLMDVLKSFGFGDKWCGWIKGSLSASMASVLVNGSPTAEFQFFRGLKQGDPLAPYLFILVMESLHLSFSRTVDVGIFKGIQIGKDFTLSHLFYADDAVFIGEWSDENLSRILHVLHCFSLASGLKINVKKSHLLGVGVSNDATVAAATNLGCAIMKAPFKYLGVMVGGNMSRIDAWDETLSNLRSRLSKWKSKTLSIGGRLTLLKSVLGSSPIYAMSLYKVPKSVLSSMEAIRRNFFYGSQEADKNITWVKWSKVLAAKQFGGLGVSSLFSLNRALLMRWVWRFIFHDNSFWCRFISAVHGPSFQVRSGTSLWRTITSEVNGLKAQGVDILSHCLKRVGNGLSTKFWFDPWIVNVKLCNEFPRLFALELNKSISVAEKLQHSVDTSFRRPVRGGSESAQLESLSELIEGVILSNSRDRWFWDMNGSGTYRVKDVRNMLDDFFLPKDEVATRWLPHLPIKLNVFAWRLYLDRLPTKSNLIRRGIQVGSPICPNCISYDEDVPHIFFKCPLAIEVSRAVCRWWDVVWVPCGSYSEWLSWLLSIKMGSRIKSLFEGVWAKIEDFVLLTLLAQLKGLDFSINSLGLVQFQNVT